MLQRNASFRLQNLQTLQSMSGGPQGAGRGLARGMGSFAATGLTGATAMAGQSMTQEQIISWMEDAMVKPGASSSSSSTSSSSSSGTTSGSSASTSNNLPRLQSIGDLMRHQSMSDILGKNNSVANLAKALNGQAGGGGAGGGGGGGSGRSNNKGNLTIPGVTMLKEDEVKV